MKSPWAMVKFQDFFSEPVKNGIYKSVEYQGRGVNIVNMKELFGYEFIGNQNMRKIDLTQSEKSRFLLKNGDLIFARRSLVEEGSGKTSLITGLTNELTFESSIIRVRLDRKKAEPLFYYYYLVSIVGRPSIVALSTGVNVKGIRGSDLKNVLIPLPPLPTQQKIAQILSVYDDLIENNLKRIKLLEEMAQQTYEEWFVRMKFPNHKTIPIDAETGLPEGWEIITLDNVADITSSKRIFLADYVENGIPFFRGKEIILKSKNETITDQLYISHDRYNEIKKTFGVPCSGEILITAVGTLGYPYLVTDKDGEFYFKDGNLIWFRDINSDEISHYLISMFKNPIFKQEIDGITIGSSQKALTIKSLKTLRILLPADAVLKDFCKIVIPAADLVNTLLNKNQLLKEARDILLPRLMTGMIDVDKIKIPSLP